MQSPRSFIASILGNHCPACREGRLFTVRNPYRWRTINALHPACPKCGENFLREPGFYFGAAYVNYGMTVALWVAVLVALYTFGALGWIEFTGMFDQPETFLYSGVAALLVLLPPIQRLSRSLWIHFFVRFKRKA
ncbi:MAG TPA: DUF983 domain-containing protein [Flavobacteriales bacterium]|nr:DUF983 domain-containing protein [Flavobacteriales bacterium]